MVHIDIIVMFNQTVWMRKLNHLAIYHVVLNG